MNVNEQTPTPASPWDWLATLCFGPDGVQSDQLRQGTALFQSLVDSLPLNLMIKDRDGRRVFANRGYLELHQVEFDDVRGKSDFDLFPEKIARRFREEDVRVLEQGITLQGVEEQPMRDEQSRWIERIKGPLRGADGEIRGVQVLFWDVTGRRQTEQALDLERGLLHSLMDNIPDAIYFKDRESRFIRVSRAMQDKHGLADPDEVVGQTDEDLFTEEHAQQALADEREIMRTGEPLVARLERETWPHRNDTWVSTTKMPLRNSDGATVGTFGISRDVTELKQAQDQLLHARDAANAASKAKSDFLANVSHEIRTPMNGIIGMTELLLNTELSDEQHEYQSIVKSSAHALLSLLNSILDFSKIESGKLELEIVPFELRETIGNTLQTLAARAAQKGLELAVRIPPEAPERLLGDPSRLRQILVNLVGNAIKFTDRGEVVVEVAVDSIDRHMSDLHFTVRDTGPGVPPEKQARIFEAFSQADASTTRKYGGTGLGLAISTQLVQLMGGRIWVESELGQGSTFHFVARLPLAPGKGPTTTGDFETLHGVPVLVVDDSQTNRLICQELLSVWGMNPTAVEGGQAAVALLRKTQATANPFRLVLLDVMMPGMDGFDVAKRMREDQGLADVAIIMLSSAGRPGDAAQARDLGVARCMTKPVTQSELLNAITQTLGAALGDVEPSTSLTESRPSDFRSKRVLLVEDGLVNQKVSTSLLQQRGHQVVLASDGRQAVERFAAEPFDVILMDIQMPVMDGFEATAAIRRREREAGDERRIPIVAMTAHAMKGDRERCLKSGMDDYVSKPFAPRELFQAVERTVATPAADRKPAADREPRAAERGQPAAEVEMKPYDRDTALQSVDGSEDLLSEMAEVFRQECPIELDRIQNAHAAGDFEALARAAHTLKGSASFFGADPVRNAAVEIELMGRNRDVSAYDDVWRRLRREVERLKSALAEI